LLRILKARPRPAAAGLRYGLRQFSAFSSDRHRRLPPRSGCAECEEIVLCTILCYGDNLDALRLHNNDAKIDREVKMTLTALRWGLAPAIAHDAQRKILRMKGVDEVDVQLVWDRPWNQNMITKSGRMKLVVIQPPYAKSSDKDSYEQASAL
jgi:metal-sulfur cluster biosynthetic enzyme